MTPRTHVDPAEDGGTASASGRRPERLAPVLVPLFLIVVLLGPHLLGMRSLSPSDQLYNWEPWRSERPADLTPTPNAPFTDNYDTLFPARSEFVERARGGEWPLWTQLTAGGTDLTTNIHTAAIAPSALVALSTPGWYAPALLKALEILGAWTFVFLFLRRVTVGRWASAFAGAVFALSGFQVVWVNWPHTRVAMFAAGLLWAFDRVLERTTPDRVAVAAMVLAATVLEGFPAVAAVGAGAAAIILSLRLAHYCDGVADAARRAAGALGAGMLGAALTAVTTLPFAANLRQLGLERGIGEDAAFARGLGTVLVPNALGTAHRYFGPGNFVEIVGYLGIAAALSTLAGLALVATGRRLDHKALLLLVSAVAGSLMLLYSYGVEPLFDLVKGLPVLSTSSPTRVKASGLLLLALSSGLGLDRLLTTRPAGAARWIVTGITTVGLLVAGTYLWGFVGPAAAATRDEVRSDVLTALVLGVLALGAIVALVLGGDRRPVRVGAVGLLFAVMAVDAVTWILPYWPRSEPEEFFPVTAAHEFLSEELGEDRFGSLQPTLLPSTNEFYGLRAVTGHVFHRPEWEQALVGAGAEMQSQTYSVFTDPEVPVDNPLLDRLAVTYWADHAGVARCEPAADSLTPAAADPTVGPSRTLSTTFTGEGVRGMIIQPAEAIPPGTELTLTASGPGGTTTASRVLHSPPGPGEPIVVGVPALENDPGPHRLTLTSSVPIGALVTAPRPCIAPDDGLDLVHASGAWIYQRQDALERIRWAGSAVVETDPTARLDLLGSGELDDGTVVLSAPTDLDGIGGDATVTQLDGDGDSIRLEVSADGDGFVVIADPLQEGWTATVDGAPAPLLDADHAGVAVRVGEGTSTVVVSYRPTGLRAGLLVSGVAAVATAALLAWGAVRQIRARRHHRACVPELAREAGSTG